MQDFEQLGVFYLGKPRDVSQPGVDAAPLLLESKDLTTHAVCVGMTGSGKTGLCLTLLEEAALDGIPAIAIDPKGDLSNLLLTFPQLRSDDFLPWIDSADAARQGKTADELAEKTSRTWREGLAAWGQDGDRIARFRESVDLAVYTPGGSAGLPLTVLRSFAAPPAALREDDDAFRQRVTSAASGLLALLGVDADPLRSREHVLVASVLDHYWRRGQDLDLESLLRNLQSPPFEKLGFVDLETFFPTKERFGLALQLNNLLASPGFAGWLAGEPLDIGKLLYTDSGKPRLSIISISHLSDPERMFVVTLLLNELLAWMRAQPGTSSLRALWFMDEVFGFLPPTANPPSKIPMLTLLKQARAYGLGVVLATQNPVDLDYKGLSNAGVWFLGRLQTDRDKARVLDGLEGASTAAGASFDRARIEATLSSLGKRMFLMNNVHEDQPLVFETRWTLSYLRGPLTREQLRAITAQRKSPNERAPAAQQLAPPAASADGGSPSTQTPPSDTVVASSGAQDRPVLPPDVAERFLGRAAASVAPTLYEPALLGQARLHYVETKSSLDHWDRVTLVAPVTGGVPDDPWSNAQSMAPEEATGGAPAAQASFAPLPPELGRGRNYAGWTNALRDFLYRARPLMLLKCPDLNLVSKPGESEAEFRLRLGQAAREARDEKLQKLRQRFASKLATAQEQLRKAEQRIEREKAQSQQQTVQAAVSFGASALSALFGRKVASSANVGRAATAIRAAGRAAREQGDVGQAQETAAALQQKLANLESDLHAEATRLHAATAPDQLKLEPYPVRPRKSDLSVERVMLAWLPSE